MTTLTPLKSIAAIERIERLAKRSFLSKDDQSRCLALVKSVRLSPDGRLRRGAVFPVVFPNLAASDKPSSAFTKFRQRLAEAAANEGFEFEIDVTGNKKLVDQMIVTFHAVDDADLPLTHSPHHKPAEYTEQWAQREVKRIFISSADKDATEVNAFLQCLKTALRIDPNEQVQQWVNSIFWHREWQIGRASCRERV